MGACFSKKRRSSSTPPPSSNSSSAAGVGYAVADSSNKNKPRLESEATESVELKTKVKQSEIEVKELGGGDRETQVQVKKEVFIIKHRKSHDERAHQNSPLPQQQPSDPVVVASGCASPSQMSAATSAKAKACNELGDERVRTQSCNKEELDAILIQCGRLSRSNSSGTNRKYSGSKRSYDFDASCSQDDGNLNVNGICGGDDGVAAEETHRHRQSSRHSSPSSQGRRRRTPSRERNQQQQQRSSSRERRTSRSPAKRSSSPSQPNTYSSSNANANANRPGKMVSVPAAAISSSNINSNGDSAAPIKRVSVKRNVGSPRCQSPARANARGGPNDGQQQPSLSRSSSRKAEHSPYRRNPLADIDPNTLSYPQAHNNRPKKEGQAEEEAVVKEPTNFSKQAPMQKPTLEFNNRIAPQGVNYITSTTSILDNKKAMTANCSSKELHPQNIVVEEAKGQQQGKPQTLTRSRSSRRSRDLDIDPETATLSNPAPSLYTTLLLQDIQNFHQQSTTNAVSLPPCVTKACSILEAVADLNSATKSAPTDQLNKKTNPGSGYNCSVGTTYNFIERSVAGQPKDPFVESEVVVNDDLTQPSFHKYVTVRRGTGALEGGMADMEDQESSGSNSFVSGSSRSQQHHWGLSSSTWEPNSADSTDCSKEESQYQSTPLSFDIDEAARKRLSRKRDSNDHHQRSGGIGRGRLGVTNTKGLHAIQGLGATASM